MDQGFDQFTAIQFIVIVGVVHFEVVELQLLFAHFARVDRHLQVLGDVSGNARNAIRMSNSAFLRAFY